MTERRFPPSWTAEVTLNCFIARDANSLLCEEGRRSAAKLLTKDGADRSEYREAAGAEARGRRSAQKTGASSNDKDDCKAYAGHYGEAGEDGDQFLRDRDRHVSGCRLRQPSRPIAPNVLDLGDKFTRMREAFLNLPQ
jgi:hypothetical protein